MDYERPYIIHRMVPVGIDLYQLKQEVITLSGVWAWCVVSAFQTVHMVGELLIEGMVLYASHMAFECARISFDESVQFEFHLICQVR